MESPYDTTCASLVGKGLMYKRKTEDEQFGTLADLQFGTSAKVPSNFECLVGYRTLRDEGQVMTVFGRVSQASICIAQMACPCHPYIQSLPTL